MVSYESKLNTLYLYYGEIKTPDASEVIKDVLGAPLEKPSLDDPNKDCDKFLKVETSLKKDEIKKVDKVLTSYGFKKIDVLYYEVPAE